MIFFLFRSSNEPENEMNTQRQIYISYSMIPQGNWKLITIPEEKWNYEYLNFDFILSPTVRVIVWNGQRI